MKLDKKLDRILYNMDLPATGKLINVQEWQKNQIKSVILEALKAEIPRELSQPTRNMQPEDVYSHQMGEALGYNQAIEDCLEVCNKLLGDSNE